MQRCHRCRDEVSAEVQHRGFIVLLVIAVDCCVGAEPVLLLGATALSEEHEVQSACRAHAEMQTTRYRSGEEVV